MNTDIRHCTFTSKKIPWVKFDGTLVAVTRDYYVVSNPFTYEFGVPRCSTYPREEWEISEYVKPAKSGCVKKVRRVVV